MTMSYETYLKRKEVMGVDLWKNIKKAFPDWGCECLNPISKRSMISTRCDKCGADRTAANWTGVVFCIDCNKALKCHDKKYLADNPHHSIVCEEYESSK